MIVRHISEYKCDGQYCLAKIRISSVTREYGYIEEFRELERRGWKTSGLQVFCKKHGEPR